MELRSTSSWLPSITIDFDRRPSCLFSCCTSSPLQDVGDYSGTAPRATCGHCMWSEPPPTVQADSRVILVRAHPLCTGNPHPQHPGVYPHPRGSFERIYGMPHLQRVDRPGRQPSGLTQQTDDAQEVGRPRRTAHEDSGCQPRSTSHPVERALLGTDASFRKSPSASSAPRTSSRCTLSRSIRTRIAYRRIGRRCATRPRVDSNPILTRHTIV